MIIDFANEKPGTLEVFVIAGLGALKVAVEKTGGNLPLKTIWIQGQWKDNGATIDPELAAWNLKVDSQASDVVFNALQDKVPFKLLGKWTAYQTQVTVDDFIELDKVDPSSDILNTALTQINTFRKAAPFIMWYLYPGTWNTNPQHALGHPGAKPLPPDKAKAEEIMKKPYPSADSDEWCSYLTYISMPYDPNLILWAFTGDSLFEPEKKTVGGIEHEVVGNTEAIPGAKDPATAKQTLVTTIQSGLTGAIQTPDDGSAKPQSPCPAIAAKVLQPVANRPLYILQSK